MTEFLCFEFEDGAQCGLPARWWVGQNAEFDLGGYLACDLHALDWAADLRTRLVDLPAETVQAIQEQK